MSNETNITEAAFTEYVDEAVAVHTGGLRLPVRVKPMHKDAELPRYMTPHAAGCDFITPTEFTLHPFEMQLIYTGLAMAVPQGFGLFLFARSGWSRKYRLTLQNGVGVIDADYRDEIGFLLVNQGHDPIRFVAGERIGQGVFMRVWEAAFDLVDNLDETQRKGGFGSTNT